MRFRDQIYLIKWVLINWFTFITAKKCTKLNSKIRYLENCHFELLPILEKGVVLSIYTYCYSMYHEFSFISR